MKYFFNTVVMEKNRNLFLDIPMKYKDVERVAVMGGEPLNHVRSIE